MEKVSLPEAARRMNVSEDTVRRRIHKGELAAFQEPTAQGFKWLVELPEDTSATTTATPNAATAASDIAAPGATAHQTDARVATIQDAIAETTATLRDLVDLLKGQLATKDMQIGELHVLLQQAQKALPPPRQPAHPRWLRWWRHA